MAENRRQHYVPKFYLRNFGNGPRQIDLLHLPTNRLVRNASITGQCYRNNFYGSDGELERAFALQEAQLSRLLRRVHEELWIPQRATEDWVSLMLYIAMQHTRTQAAATLTDETLDQAFRHALAEDERFDDETLAAMRLKTRHPVQISLSAARDSALGFDDLQPLLLTSSGSTFVTSDHPVALYNTYAESVTWAGVVGSLCSGLQLFYPLTPTCCLVLYDGRVYGVSPRRQIVPAQPADAEQINKIIVSQAGENIYFGSWMEDDVVLGLAESVTRVRSQPKVKFTKADEVRDQPRSDGTRRVLLHMFFPFPVIRLKLSMMRLRKNAKQTPIQERGSQYRRILPGRRPPEQVEPGIFRVRSPQGERPWPRS